MESTWQVSSYVELDFGELIDNALSYYTNTVCF
jgi:hypothetical protein